MEVGGDQAGGQAGGDGDEEVEAKGFVNVKFTSRRCRSWEEVWEKVVGDPFQNAEGPRRLTVLMMLMSILAVTIRNA